VCYNAIDRHIDEGRGEQIGLIYDSPLTKTVKKLTYSQLQEKVCYQYLYLGAL
jgi:propionyl-CoA synthetase